MGWSDLIGDGLGSVATEMFGPAFTRDNSIDTCQPGEAEVRKDLDFTNIYFSFPTTTRTNIFGRLLDTNRLAFPAYVTSFKDDFNMNWGQEEVFGRADPIAIYKNTKRSISFNLMIPCYDREDANENMKKINALIKNLYPSYIKENTGAVVLNNSPLVRVKFANMVVNHTNPALGLLGFITSFNTDFGVGERGVFLDSNYTGGIVLPRAIGFSFTMTVLHESTVGFDGTAENKFFGSQQFPYRTKERFGGQPGGFLGSKAGLGSAAALAEITGEKPL